jgi:hypothetical protein
MKDDKENLADAGLIFFKYFDDSLTGYRALTISIKKILVESKGNLNKEQLDAIVKSLESMTYGVKKINDMLQIIINSYKNRKDENIN